MESLLNNICSGPSAWPAASRASGCWRRFASTRSNGWPSAATARRCNAVTRSFYASLAERADPALFGPQQLSWLERLDAELANIRGALTWAAESGESEVGLRIGTALWRYWQLRGSIREGRERLELLLSGRAGSKAARARAQFVLASLASPQGDHETVCRLIEASLPVHRALGDDVVVAISLALLGLSELAQGDVERARALTQEGLVLARRTRDLPTEAMLLANVGVVLAATGDLDGAEQALEESVDAARRLGNLRSVGNWLRALGSISLARRDYARARLRFEESLGVGRTLGDRWEIAHSLSNLALVALEAQDDDAARAMLAESTRSNVRPVTGWAWRATWKCSRGWPSPRVTRRAPVASTRAHTCSASPWASTRSRSAGPIPSRTSPGFAPRSERRHSPTRGRRDGR